MSKKNLLGEVKQVQKFGPFTIAEVEYVEPINENRGMIYKGWGISRLGRTDKYKPEVGENIAISRARKALYNKLKGKNVNITLAG